jgi:hypothetical protein
LNYSDDKAGELVALDDALQGLAAFDERKALVIELRYFGGLSVEETAEAQGISVATVGRETRYALSVAAAGIVAPVKAGDRGSCPRSRFAAITIGPVKAPSQDSIN